MGFVMVLDGARGMRDWGGRNAAAGRQRDAVCSSNNGRLIMVVVCKYDLIGCDDSGGGDTRYNMVV